jgi:pullulanase/glycogen debranching enzyme
MESNSIRPAFRTLCPASDQEVTDAIRDDGHSPYWSEAISSVTNARQELLSMLSPDFELNRGSPIPFGASVQRGGINFAIFSKHATEVTLVLFYPGDRESLVEFPLDPRINRTGDVWHAFLQGLNPGIHYAFRMDRVPNENPLIYRFDHSNALLDPYARALSERAAWGVPASERAPRCCAVIDSRFDWEYDQPLNIPLADSVIYEAHVRGFTRHPSSGVGKPGTFAGLIEKIPYLQSLGVTAVELLPIYEFEECGNVLTDPASDAQLYDYWGYNPISFFVPNAAYSSKSGRFRTGVRVQNTGQGAACGRDRSHPRRGVQSHGGRRREGPDALVPRHRQSDVLHAQPRRPAST